MEPLCEETMDRGREVALSFGYGIIEADEVRKEVCMLKRDVWAGSESGVHDSG